MRFCTSASGGYPCSNMGPSDRVLEAGDVLMIDTGVSCDGYYCDFDRDYAFGLPSEQVRRAYDLVWRATEAGIAAARPGRRACDVWRAQAEVLAGWDNAGAEREGFGVGRYGHGVGLRMCEPPSNSPIDEQPLLERMTLTIEPGLTYHVDGPDGKEKRVLLHEENVVLTAADCELLTRRAPREIPVIE